VVAEQLGIVVAGGGGELPRCQPRTSVVTERYFSPIGDSFLRREPCSLDDLGALPG
jgi:hypothetical protein